MKAIQAVISWNPRTGEVGVATRAGPRGQLTVGAVFADWLTMSPETRLAQLFINFHTMVVRDHIDPQRAHSAFLAVDEYRAAVSPEIA
jgi:hypothetical protein